MRITNMDSVYAIDRAVLTTCMEAMGFTEGDIYSLCLTIRPEGTKAIQKQEDKGGYTIFGYFNAPNSIAVFTHNQSLSSVNTTIVHELSHYLDEVLLNRRRLSTLKHGPGKRLSSLEWIKIKRNEQAGEYRDRPNEVRARQVSGEFSPRYQMVYDTMLGAQKNLRSYWQ